jgi:epoxyqueuosine reductase
MPNLNEEITVFLKTRGVGLVGFASLHEIDSTVRQDLLYGISIGVALDARVMSGITEGPTPSYYDEYHRANQLLDSLGREAAGFLVAKGYRAVSLVATNAGIDPQTLSTPLPHKTVATRAGIGWIGKCCLLVTKKYGSAVRLATILTDAPVTPAKPVDESLCGHCTHCIEACPARAHTGALWAPGLPREVLFNAFKCRETARRLEEKLIGTHESICGICIVTCPWTRKYLTRSTGSAR